MAGEVFPLPVAVRLLRRRAHGECASHAPMAPLATVRRREPLRRADPSTDTARSREDLFLTS
jgi:hypothetical protein